MRFFFLLINNQVKKLQKHKLIKAKIRQKVADAAQEKYQKIKPKSKL